MKVISKASSLFGGVLTFVFLFFVSALYGQQNRGLIELKDTRQEVIQLLKQIEGQSDYTFIYSDRLRGIGEVVSLASAKMPVGEILGQITQQTRLRFRQEQGSFIITEISVGHIEGVAKTHDGSPLAFATVTIDAYRGTQTDMEGHFAIRDLEPGMYTVTVSFVGLKPLQQEVRVYDDKISYLDLTFGNDMQVLQEVEVRGQRRKIASLTKIETELIDLPAAVQLVDQQIIRQQQIIDVRDAVKNVSGITMGSTYAGAYINLTGRGFEMLNWSNYRRNGMFIWNMGHHYNDNIERIEVLKGPASFLYGDVSPGATINFVTKKPLEYDMKRFEMKVGQYGLIRPTFDLTGPLNDKKTLLYRINATYEGSNSFIDEVRSDVIMFAPALTWKISPDLSWDIEANFKNDDRTYNWGLVSPDGTFDGLKKIPVSRFLGEPSNLYRFKDDGLYSRINYNLGKSFSLRNTTYFTKTQRVVEGMYYPNTVPDEAGDFVRQGWMTSSFYRGWGSTLDLSGILKTGSVIHNVVLGGDYMINTIAGVPVVTYPYEPINVYRPVYGLTSMAKNPGYPGVDFPREYYTRYGLYVQDQLKMWDEKVQLLLGLRYNISETGTKYTAKDPAPEGYRPYRQTPFSPRLGLLVKVLPNLSVYGSYTNSYELNEIDFLSQQLVDETTSYQYEAGIKTNIVQDRLGIGLTAFRIDKKNVFGYVWDLDAEPDFDYIAYSPEQRAASYIGGHHRSQGVEFDANGQITEALNINLSAAWVDAFIVDDPAFETGNQLAENARITSNVWVNYRFLGSKLRGFEAGYGFFFKDKFYGSNNNDPEELVSSYWSMDASIGYRYRKFFSRVTVSNLTNNIGYLGGWGVYQPMYVRRAVLSVGMEF